ncbi:helix-turn-helix domain-containing protein [Bacteroides heparinolyticus]|uniref:helix-turn-helix domain-containing protein n=1 Tax=Prevotella heparinolytica TaxID=28113 RepID=UPI0035A06B64
MLKLYENIKKLRIKNDMSQGDLAQKVGYKDRTSIAKIEAGNVDLSQSKIVAFARALGVSPAYLMGWDEEAHNKAFADAILIEMPESVLIPVYGKIKAGVPLEAIEDVEEHIDVPAKWIESGRKIIGLKVDGDSMYPKYFDGDIVVLECDIDYYSGDDCAVYVNGYEATIKQIKWIDDGIELIPINTVYPPKKYKKEDFSILGKVIEMRRRF